jgi:hypothetical protein
MRHRRWRAFRLQPIRIVLDDAGAAAMHAISRRRSGMVNVVDFCSVGLRLMRRASCSVSYKESTGGGGRRLVDHLAELDQFHADEGGAKQEGACDLAVPAAEGTKTAAE